MTYMSPIISVLGLIVCVFANRLATWMSGDQQTSKRWELNIWRVGEIAYFCGLLAYLLTNHLAQNVLFK